MKNQNVRLSNDVIPTRYSLHLKPDLEAFVFEGDESIDLKIKKKVTSITLHSVEIEIESAAIRVQKKTYIARKITYDEKAETATLHFHSPVPAGRTTLDIKFRGILNDSMHGFYRSRFEHDGKTKHIATTQFESTDARRAFPCFDEPAKKAVFEISLTVPNDSTAISNTLPIDIKEHEGGYKTVQFSATPPMSTYLAAFIVGEFESIEMKSKDGILVRVFTTPGKKHQAKFALECAAKTITFFNKYFGIPYPLPVVDLIAIPDFAAGAMENWGAITYRESALLVDPKESSTMNKQWVALVIAHELAHQWFGNLVTMEWWTHLWLNEGFASYIEYLAVDKLFPSWNIWTQFLNADMRPAFHLDALKHTHPIEVEVHHPSEIAAVFDAVSYSKGASIIRMLAEYLGERDFRDGLRYYLKKHCYSNTVTEDLWSALQKVSGKPVGRIMAKWTGSAGYPLVQVSVRGESLHLEQKRFFESPISAKESKDRTVWQIPVRALASKGSSDPVLMSKKRVSFKAPGGWVKLNAGETSFFRTIYEKDMRDALAKAARNKKMPVRDRLGLIRDVFAVAESGQLGAADALEFAQGFSGETEYVVWAELASSISTIHGLFFEQAFRPRFQTWVLGLFSRIGKTSSFSSKPKNHEGALLKILVLSALSRFGDAKTIAEARRLFKKITARANPISADTRGVVYATVARSGGKAEHAILTRIYKHAALHEEKNRIGAALTLFSQKELLEKTLAFSLSKDVRPQDSVRFIAGIAMNPRGRDIAWRFMQKNWQTLTARYKGGRELSYMLDPIGASSSLKRAAELANFLKSHPAPGTERTVAQVVERIKSNAAWLERDKKSLSRFFTD